MSGRPVGGFAQRPQVQNQLGLARSRYRHAGVKRQEPEQRPQGTDHDGAWADDLVASGDEAAPPVADVQRVIDEYSRKLIHREIAELAETAVDSCKKVFHRLGDIYLKET